MPLPPMVTPETQEAINRGLEYLARTQSRDGAWRQEGQWGSYPMAMSGLAGMAFLASGSTATQGQYAPQVSRVMNFVLNSVRSDGLISRPEEAGRSMYGHGFCTMFLGQLYGMEDDPERQARIHGILQRAVALIGRSQSDLGGWYYTPESRNDEGSVTITQLQALRSARNAGVAVPKQVVDDALDYLVKSLHADGGITYRADGRGPSRPPITAAAVACWFNAGEYDNPHAVKALDYCRRRVGRGEQNGTFGHYFYAHFYMAQIMWLSGEKDWEWYYPRMRDRLLDLQQPDGSWDGDRVGKIYGTSIALVILQMPYGYMPIMQR